MFLFSFFKPVSHLEDEESGICFSFFGEFFEQVLLEYGRIEGDSGGL